MTFLYPLGLLGLIGIPILIIIYIIKSKYTEQTVSSTYLWILSEKFIKKKNPLSRLTGIISLILQILTITVVSLAIAHPMITIPDAAYEYCFILDASGSMNMDNGSSTRFENGKTQIATMINEASEGSIYSLIYVGDATTVVFEKTDNKEHAQILLDELKPSYVKVDMTAATEIAQGYFDENPSVLTYLVTDTLYRVNNNVTLASVSRGEKNASILDASYTLTDGKLTVRGTAMSYNGSVPLNFNLYVDGSEEPIASAIYVIADKKSDFMLTAEDVESVASVRVAIEEADSLLLDNEFIIYNQHSEASYKTLLVSDRPFFFRAAIQAILNTKVDVMTTAEYTESPRNGYGLYIMDCYAPTSLPNDGTVWLVNLNSSLESAGFSVQGEQPLETGVEVSLSTSSSSMTKKLTENMLGDGIYIAGGFMKYGVYRNFTSILTYQGNPIVFAGTNDLGNRQVVFAFDIHNSNIPLTADFLTLTKNLLDYSFPAVVESTVHHCGDEVEINLPANCDSIKVESPDGGISYLSADGAVASLKLYEVGSYTVTMTVGSNVRTVDLYSAMHDDERAPSVIESEFSLAGEAESGGFDGLYDPLVILFIVLCVVFLADWMVYCYEKCQLR